MLSIFSILLIASATVAHPLNEDFYQPVDSPIAALFSKRAPSPSDADFSSHYPGMGSTPPQSMIPQAWRDKLASTPMPNIPVTIQNAGYPSYGTGRSGADKDICSFTYGCVASGDFFNAPDGIWVVTFDDGPGQVSGDLNTYLQQNNISSHATHFMIGGNILGSPTAMQQTAGNGGHIAVHTWSHPYMTTLSNLDILSELGWTMQIISDLNGGRLPRYWRPPYGDVDNRVRAIAKGVFGLETVVWNQDTGDWAIGSNPAYTLDSVRASVRGWFTGSKSPGIISLEHELNPNELTIFQYAYPIARDNGWQTSNVADAFNMTWYQNAVSGNTGPVVSMAVAGNASSNMTANSTSTVTSSASSISGSGSGSTSISTTTTSSSSSGLPKTTTAAAALVPSSSVKSGSSKQVGVIVSGMLGFPLVAMMMMMLL